MLSEWSYRTLFRPLLFLLDSERAHDLMMAVARRILARPAGRKLCRAVFLRGRLPDLSVALAPGLRAATPLGLAAGFDKNGLLGPHVAALGFGFMEVGTVTPRPQEGNPKPRMSRIVEKRALLNRLGFNNRGADALENEMRRWDERPIPVGVNIGKNKDTPEDRALDDYETLLKRFAGRADYFTINVSSPNTPGLRALQSAEFLSRLGAVITAMKLPRPVFVKLAPELGADELAAVCALCGPGKAFTGLVLTNTLMTDRGGISGEPLRERSMAALKAARRLLDPEVPVISVGGLSSAADVRERMAAGATAVQLYSALIYEGPGLPGRILRELADT